MSERLDKLRKLHAADPDDTFVTYAIALEHAKAGEPDAAIDWLDRTLARDPHYHYAYFQKAKALDAKGEPDAAREVLETGITAARDAGDEKAAREMNELLATL